MFIKYLTSIIIGLGLFSTTYASIPTVTGLGGSTNTASQSTATSSTSGQSQLSKISTANKAPGEPFCSLNSQGISDDYDIYKSPLVTEQENKYIVLTYLSTYGYDLLKSEEERINTSVLSKDKNARVTTITPNLIYAEKKNNSRYNLIYSKLEQECIKNRSEYPEYNENIKGLYRQVQFFNKYYSKYPPRLLEGITPPFLITIVEFTELLSIYILILAILNIIFLTVKYMHQPDKAAENLSSIIHGFYYFVIVIGIKLGVIGSILAFIGFEGVNLIEFFFSI